MAVEVGDEAGGVRQERALLERGAALVVDQDEDHLIGPVPQRQGGDEGLQQLGLARARRPADQHVGTVAAQVHGVGPGRGDAEQGRRGARLRAPAGGHVLRRQAVRSQDVQEPRAVGNLRTSCVRGGITQACQRAGEPVRPAVGHRVGHDILDGGRRSDVSTVSRDGCPGLDVHHRTRLDRKPCRVGVHADEVDTDRRAVPKQQGHTRNSAQPLGAVEQDDAVRTSPRATPQPLLPRPPGDERCQLGDPAADLVPLRRQQPHEVAALGVDRRAGVRQVRRPRPVAPERGVGAQDAE